MLIGAIWLLVPHADKVCSHKGWIGYARGFNKTRRTPPQGISRTQHRCCTYVILSLQRLEAQLAAVQDKIKMEEEEGEKLLQKYKRHSTPGGPKGFDGKCCSHVSLAVSSPSCSDHNEYFWEKVLTQDDRRQLESHGIRSCRYRVSSSVSSLLKDYRLSVDELAYVHDTVQSKLSQPPHPKIEDLDAKSRCALKIHQSIPTRLNDSGRSKTGSWLGGWF